MLVSENFVQNKDHRYSKTCLKQPLKKKTKIGFQDWLLLNAGQKYCRMLQGEHSALLSTFIKLQFVIKIFVLSIFEWPLKTGFTVCSNEIFSSRFKSITIRKFLSQTMEEYGLKRSYASVESDLMVHS